MMMTKMKTNFMKIIKGRQNKSLNLSLASRCVDWQLVTYALNKRFASIFRVVLISLKYPED